MHKHDFPPLDFRLPSLCLVSRMQLHNTYDSASKSGRIPASKNALLTWLSLNYWRPESGLYLPISDSVYLAGMLPLECRSVSGYIDPSRYQYFSNGLRIPTGFGAPGFKPCLVEKPMDRAANSGMVVVTLEFDCRSVSEFEETLSWTRKNASGSSPLEMVHAALCRFKDYRGYSVVFSGGKSLHFHFLFSTEHLVAFPANAPTTERNGSDCKAEAAFISRAHWEYWDRTWEIFQQTVKPSIGPDRRLRSYVQWRRIPWGLRRLKEASLLGIPAGSLVPQIVVTEYVLSRAARGSAEFCVSPHFSVAHPPRASRRFSGRGGEQRAANSLMFDEADALFRAEWGPYPELVRIDVDGGEWVFKFRNHAGDANPSTLVRGDHRKLLVQGGGHALPDSIFLPAGVTAQELGDHLARCSGIGPASQAASGSSEPRPKRGGPFTLSDLKMLTGTPLDWARQDIEAAFPAPISDQTLQEAKQAYRDKLRRALREARQFDAGVVVRSGEGIGKTSGHVPVLLEEALDDALNHSDGRMRFAAIACRSRAQAEQKAKEIQRSGKRAVMIRPFSEHYEEACRRFGQTPIGRNDFDEFQPEAILQQIRERQPAVYAALEEVRKDLWAGEARFDAGTTLLVMTHKAAALWHSTHLTRAWHHPEFDLDAPERFGELAQRLVLARVVFDDPEPDDFIHVLKGSAYDKIHEMQTRVPDWRHKGRRDRLNIYGPLASELPGELAGNFAHFDELMRLDLRTLSQVDVDFAAIPFGSDQDEEGIYRRKHGERYFIGPRPWISATTAHVTFLTTEQIVTEVIDTTLKKSPGVADPFRLDLIDLPGIYPIRIPAFIDKRAAADRAGDRRVSALAEEILQGNSNAVVVSDGTKGVDGVLSFQGAKGRNGLEDKDVYIVATNLAPEKYAELNVLGQWLGLPDVIGLHYQDQLDQAVGRNRGFRQSGAETKTVVITSLGLWVRVLCKLDSGASRSRLYRVGQRPWDAPDSSD
ncbi:hypothetical protein ACRAWG_08690 [Methylobacterium sp. P31]